ncbi:RHS repeat-associated protein, partial [Hydrogenispora ethanolica]
TRVTRNGATQLDSAYDGTGMRVKKVENGKTTYYIYAGANPLLEYSDGKYLYRIYAGNHAIAEETGGVVKFYHKDHLGSTRVVTSATGAKLAEYKFAPYGEKELASGDGTAYQFTDKAEDVTTGLDYFGFRFYDPEVGRFISQDPIKDGANWFAYCYDNPIRYIDPLGLRVGDNDNGGWDGSGYDGDSGSSSFRDNGYQHDRSHGDYDSFESDGYTIDHYENGIPVFAAPEVRVTASRYTIDNDYYYDINDSSGPEHGYIDLNCTVISGFFIGITIGIQIDEKSSHFYVGGAAGIPGVSGSMTFGDILNDTGIGTGWNGAIEGNFNFPGQIWGGAGQVGYNFKEETIYGEAGVGVGSPGASGSIFYVF